MCGEKQFLIITGLGFHLTHMKLKNKPLFELNRILSDKTSGSTDLVIKLNKWVRKYGKNLQLIYDMIKKVSRELKSFTVVDSYLKRLKRIISRNDSNAIKNFSINFEESFREIYHRLYLNARKEIGNVDTILTISNSRTLKEVFTLWSKEEKNLKFIITESRPNYEGKLLAREILKNKLKVELITDAMISLYIPKVDAVIIGADKILKNGNVINKVGSLPAAVLCKHFKKPFYVIATKDKFSKEKQLKAEEKNYKEVWNFNHFKLKITNIYFEEIDRSLITKVITES